MRNFALLVLFSVGLSTAALARSGSRVEYLGGTRADIPERRSGEIRVTDHTYFIYVSKHTQVRIPFVRINLVEYGQKVDHRYVAALISPVFAMSKKREHFLTIGFQDDEGQQEAMVFRIEKDDVRLTLVSLEARTGQQIQYQDEDARIAGRN